MRSGRASPSRPPTRWRRRGAVAATTRRLLADVESDPEATLDRWMWATVSAVGSRYWDSVWPRFDTDNDSDDTAPVVDGPLMIPVLELVNYATLEQSNAGVGLAVNCLELQLFSPHVPPSEKGPL